MFRTFTFFLAFVATVGAQNAAHTFRLTEQNGSPGRLTFERPSDVTNAQMDFIVVGSGLYTWTLGTTADPLAPTKSQFALLFGASATPVWSAEQDGTFNLPANLNVGGNIFTTFGIYPLTSGQGLGTSFSRWRMFGTYLTINDPTVAAGGVSGNLNPSNDNAYKLGDPSYRWSEINAVNLNISGTFTAPNMVTTNTNQTISGQKTFSSAILAVSSVTDIGSSGTPFGNVWGTTVYGKTLTVGNAAAGFGTSFKWSFDKYNTGLSVLYLSDPTPTDIIQIDTTILPRRFSFEGNMLPLTRATYDIGGPFPNEWRDGNFSRNVTAGGTVQGANVVSTTGTAWTAYTPTVTPGGAGTASLVTSDCAYQQFGKQIFVRCLAVTTFSNSQTFFYVSLPVNAKSNNQIFMGYNGLPGAYGYVDSLTRVGLGNNPTATIGTSAQGYFEGVYEAQ